MLRSPLRNSLSALLMLCIAAGAAFSAEQVVLKKLRNKSTFKENSDWKISNELTADLVKALELKGFKVVDYKDLKTYRNEPVLEGNITAFGMAQQEMDSLPLVSYKVYEAKLGIKLTLMGPATGQKHELNSEYTETSNKLRSLLPGPDAAEIANDRVIDFETREEIKWGSEEFNRSVVGTVRDKVINDLVTQITEILNK